MSLRHSIHLLVKFKYFEIKFIIISSVQRLSWVVKNYRNELAWRFLERIFGLILSCMTKDYLAEDGGFTLSAGTVSDDCFC